MQRLIVQSIKWRCPTPATLLSEYECWESELVEDNQALSPKLGQRLPRSGKYPGTSKFRNTKKYVSARIPKTVLWFFQLICLEQLVFLWISVFTITYGWNVRPQQSDSAPVVTLCNQLDISQDTLFRSRDRLQIFLDVHLDFRGLILRLSGGRWSTFDFNGIWTLLTLFWHDSCCCW